MRAHAAGAWILPIIVALTAAGCRPAPPLSCVKAYSSTWKGYEASTRSMLALGVPPGFCIPPTLTQPSSRLLAPKPPLFEK